MALQYYETVIILNGRMTAKRYKDYEHIVRKLVEDCSDGSYIKTIDMMGKKKLAYPIKETTEGWYVLFTYKTNPGNISSFEKYLYDNDDVLKFLTVKRSEEDAELEEYADTCEDVVESEQDKPMWNLIFE